MIIKTHPAYTTATEEATVRGLSIYAYLEQLAEDLAAKEQLKNISYLTAEFHMTADFHGNRSPLGK